MKRPRVIDWAQYDERIRALGRGEIAEMARETGLPRTSITRRRQKLGLPRLAPGRPRGITRNFTEREAQAMELRQQGRTGVEIAVSLGITPSGVTAALGRAKRKLVGAFQRHLDTRCRACAGSGGQTCRQQGHHCSSGPSVHTCDVCGGTGKTPEGSVPPLADRGEADRHRHHDGVLLLPELPEEAPKLTGPECTGKPHGEYDYCPACDGGKAKS